jgi:hypothetical protein
MVFAAALVVFCLLFGGSALEHVEMAMASGLMLAVAALAVLLFLAGALLKIFGVSGSTVLFWIAAVAFLAAAFLWRGFGNQVGVCAFGAFVSIFEALGLYRKIARS